jgi:hypothetical protein
LKLGPAFSNRAQSRRLCQVYFLSPEFAELVNQAACSFVV